jgi:hypothetical protein
LVSFSDAVVVANFFNYSCNHQFLIHSQALRVKLNLFNNSLRILFWFS